MCGLLGFLGFGENGEKLLQELLVRLAHRGPDSNGIFVSPGKEIALGHTRLSILDLSNESNQPMLSVCGRYAIAYNGEVYNFKNLRNELEEEFNFRTTSDTEVILNGFQKWGVDLFSRLNGMFAMCIWDNIKREVVIARDRSGMKPLYIGKIGSKIVFSSEIRPLRRLFPKLNTRALDYVRLLGYVPEPETILTGVVSFPAGSYGIYSQDSEKIQCYDFFRFLPKIEMSYQDCVKKLRELLELSVQRHLISDAPIGLFASGGVDSSVLCALATQFKTNLTTVSLVFEEANYSEEKHMNSLADKWGLCQNKVCITEKDFFSSIQGFLSAMDQPSVDGFNTFLVSKASKEIGLKVALSGLGGDEIFFGYPSFRRAQLLRRLASLGKLGQVFRFINPALAKLDLLSIREPINLYLVNRAISSIAEAPRLGISNELACSLFTDLSYIYPMREELSVEDQISLYELELYMKNQLLRDSDVYGMSQSLEIRIPLLDRELVDFVLKIPSSWKLGKVNKSLFIDAIADLLPTSVYQRPKKGFELPFKVWITKGLDREFSIVDSRLRTSFRKGKLHWSRIWNEFVVNKYITSLK